jgi:Trypsin-like peptidase domain/NACHT domain
MEHLYKLLEQCTVKLTIGQSQGTGFFVAPGLILTCNHVVREAGERSIGLMWNNQKNSAKAKVVGSFPDCDLALLKVDPSINVEQPCVYLGEEFQPYDKLYLFGYSNEFSDGSPVTIDCEGEIGGDLKLIKFKLGNVRPGMSGSPLLNERTGCVCGIVKFNLLDGIPGGGAVATSVILDKFPELSELQQSFHQQDRRWNNLGREREINWHTICNDLLTEHKRQLSSNPLDVKGKSFDGVYVPLGLVERKEKQRPQIDRNLDPSADRGSEFNRVEETTPIEHDEFLNLVDDRQPGEHLVILGEPGAGKTTLLTRVWKFLLDTNRETPTIVAWISLAAVKDLDLEEYLHHVWLKQICKSTEIDTYWQSFQTLLDRQRVWLLFDGADEMGGDGLTKIQTMIKPTWVKSTIRSIVTCRLNLWDASSQNVLKNDFQIFRTLDFKQDLVEAFIVKWFDDDAVAGKKLIVALDETGKERIKDLARNPLRLTLLCNIWRRGESLPDTQAGLYHKFVNYFYNWSKFPELAKLRGELDRLMGQLAKYGINKPMLRFRFTETELRNQSIDPEYIAALETLGWLNFVGMDERDDRVYAFFHPTFQEYFAACSIDDWDYFLPRAHIDRPILGEGGENLYRVFEQEWRQPMFLWFGREDIKSELKENFIEKLINFRESSYLVQSDEIERVYYYLAYFIAARCIAEFPYNRWADGIVQQIFRWALKYFTIEEKQQIKNLFLISISANEVITFTHRPYAISTLKSLLLDKTLMYYRMEMLDIVEKIATGNEVIINIIAGIVENNSYVNEFELTSYLRTLGMINHPDLKAISILLKMLFQQDLGFEIRSNVELSLATMAKDNQHLIDSLTNAINETNDDYLCASFAWVLGSIDKGNLDSIRAFIKIFEQPLNYWNPRHIAELFQSIAISNPFAINLLLVMLNDLPSESYMYLEAVLTVLGVIAVNNLEAIKVLNCLLENNNLSKNSRHEVIKTLDKISKISATSEDKIKVEDRVATSRNWTEFIFNLAQTLSYPKFHAWQQTYLPHQLKSNHTIFCNICGYEETYNRSQYCYSCGTEIVTLPLNRIACNVCGYEENPNSSYCEACGTELFTLPLNRPNTIILNITDLNTYTTPDDITTELSIRIYQQLTITPIPNTPTIPQLKRELISPQLHPHLVLILEHPNPTATLITTISNLHTPNQIQLIWLTNAPIPHALHPEQENLMAAIWSAIDRFTET